MVASTTCKKIVDQQILQKIHELNSFKTCYLYMLFSYENNTLEKMNPASISGFITIANTLRNNLQGIVR